MPTIALYKDKVNQMPGLMKDVKKSVMDYKTELSNMRKKSLQINRSICNLDEVISSLQTSTQTQEEKIASLDAITQKSEQFLADTIRIDNDVADVINKRKNEFYDKYNYLKPDCEKNGWEKFCDGCKKVGEWCKEHWKILATVALVVAAIAVIVVTAGAACTALGPVATILAGAAKGLIAGAITGGLMGGVSSAVSGGSFLDGFENGAFTGALTGALFGGLGGAGKALGSSCKVLNFLGTAANAIPVVSKVTGGISLVMAGFDLLSFGVGLFDSNNILVEFNQRLHSNKVYNAFQIGVSALAIFSGGFTKGMQNPSCFVAGTMILTAGGLVAIENIRAGDKVVSTNVDTFETAEKKVLETYIRETTKLVHLTINGELIKTTPDHPFYVKDVGFVKAGDLYVGDKVLDSNGTVFVIENMETETTDMPTTVYNFQVQDFHTYHVGNYGILVHNAGNDYGLRHTPEQQKLIKEGRAMGKKGGVSRADAESYVDRCKRQGFNEQQVRIDEGHMQRSNPTQPMQGTSGRPHLHTPSGKQHSIPIIEK